jgi:hypothetical protein
LRDNWGDGWNGGSAIIKDSSGVVKYSFFGPENLYPAERNKLWEHQEMELVDGQYTIEWTSRGSWPTEIQAFMSTIHYGGGADYSGTTYAELPTLNDPNIFYIKHDSTYYEYNSNTFSTATINVPGFSWTDAGATSDGGETVTVSGIVDTSFAGTNTITYTATDAAGNTGTATRTVTVVKVHRDVLEDGTIKPYYYDSNDIIIPFLE